jgi:replicative DNA helicase
VSIERDLISKILHERDLSVASEAGVTAKFFLSTEHREVFKFLLEHHRDYNSVPSMEAFQRNYPTYKVTKADDPMQYYVDEISIDYGNYLLEDGLVRATDLFDAGDFTEAKMTLAQCLSQVNREVTKIRAVDLTETGPERVKKYREYAKSDGALKGISTGFHMLDVATGGMQPGQLFVFVGPPKAGKSTMLLLSAMFANMGFYRPLFIGFEMSNEEQEERHDAIRAGVSHKRLRDGTLSADDYRELEKMTRRMESNPPMIFTADATSTSTLSAISALVEKFKPDVVYVDGVYMLEDENGEPKGSPQALTNITRGFKKMAQNLGIPFAISTQVLSWKMDRKRGVTTASIGYSSSFAQDADVLIGVEPTEDDNRNKVKILDGRNVKRMEIFVEWDWDEGTFRELEPGDLLEVSDEEAAAGKF